MTLCKHNKPKRGSRQISVRASQGYLCGREFRRHRGATELATHHTITGLSTLFRGGRRYSRLREIVSPEGAVSVAECDAFLREMYASWVAYLIAYCEHCGLN